jgi:hypothetical protein
MKVFDLRCEHDHRFEGWFASGEEFESQHARGLVECPLCASRAVQRMPNATRLNLGQARAAQPDGNPSGPTQPGARASLPVAGGTAVGQLHEMWLKMVRHVMENTTDVGPKFAEEARRIHYKEAPERAIRGSATQSEAQELVEEGIEIVAMPMPKYSSETVQ